MRTFAGSCYACTWFRDYRPETVWKGSFAGTTPVKYANDELKEAYKAIEDSAAHRLLEMLPEDLRAEYESYFLPEQITPEEYRYVKAADKLSALIKCIEEEKTGNQEFCSAKQATYESLQQMNMPEVTVFCEVFLPEYYKTLDELEH